MLGVTGFISREMIFDSCRMGRLEQGNVSWCCGSVMVAGRRIAYSTDWQPMIASPCFCKPRGCIRAVTFPRTDSIQPPTRVSYQLGGWGALVPTGFVTPTSMLPGIFNLAVAAFYLYLTGGVVGGLTMVLSYVSSIYNLLTNTFPQVYFRRLLTINVYLAASKNQLILSQLSYYIKIKASHNF